MDVKAVSRFVRISPSKVRDLTREIQGLPVSDAVKAMQFNARKGAFYILKTLKTAIAAAGKNEEILPEALRVKIAVAEKGPVLRRFWPSARGRASPILKRTCHIRIVLTDEKKPAKR
jgi:large subunit ribosomal protein L22